MSLKLVIGKLSEDNLYDKKIVILDNIFKEKINNKNINCTIISLPTLNIDEKQKVFYYLNDLSEKIIAELRISLNSLNNVNFNASDWKIILGPWLNNLLKISYNRFYKVKEALNKNEISEVTIFNCIDEKFVAIDNHHLTMLAGNPMWNAIMYSKIITFLKPNLNINVENLNIDFSRNKKKSIKFMFKDYLSFLFNFLTKKNDALIIQSYLPLFENVKLNFYLKQFPHLWNSIRLTDKIYNIKLRQKIVLETTQDQFEMFIKQMIPRSLPTCHLESFYKLKEIINSSKLPDKPRFIFTSNAYEYDEVFKLYVVLKKKTKTTYIIGQHGNYLSTLDNSFFKESHVADHYLDWGKNGFDKNQNGFNFKLINKKVKNDKTGKILILDSPYGTNNKIYNRIDENIVKEKFLHELLLLIDKSLHKNIVLKLHTSHKNRDDLYISRIKSICPDIRIETNDKALFRLFKISKCVIFTYDSTGIYEGMIFNIPTFCIWPNQLNNIKQKYHKFYNDLQRNDILFFEPKHLAQKINNIHNNLDKWWSNIDTKNAVTQFLEQFSNKPKKNSTKVLAKKLIELSKLN